MGECGEEGAQVGDYQLAGWRISSLSSSESIQAGQQGGRRLGDSGRGTHSQSQSHHGMTWHGKDNDNLPSPRLGLQNVSSFRHFSVRVEILFGITTEEQEKKDDSQHSSGVGRLGG